MIQPNEALQALWSIGRELFNRLDDEQVQEEYHDFVKFQYDLVLKFITQYQEQQDIKIMYAYKLRRGDGKYLNKWQWDSKGKLYSRRGNLATALGQHISAYIDTDKERPQYKAIWFTDDRGQIKEPRRYTPEYQAYLDWHNKTTNDKEFRSSFIPEDWTVIAIPLNAKIGPVEINAREWYKGAKP